MVVVYTAPGEVLLLRRRTPKNYWQSITGSLHWCERPAAAAYREVLEETGLRAARGALKRCGYDNRFAIIAPWRRRYAPRARFNLEHVYALQLARRRPVRLDPHEHTEFRWLGWEKAARTVASWTNRDAILRLRANTAC